MLTASFRRKILLILLVTVLAAPALSATGPQPKYSVRPVEGPVLEFLSRFWSFLHKVQTKEGCGIDPDGCTLQNPRPQTREGCRIDPDGRCLP